MQRVERMGTEIYAWHCTTEAFLSFHPKRMLAQNVADISSLIRVFEGKTGNSALDVAALKKSRPDVVGAITDWETAKGRFIDIKTVEPGPITGIHAGIALPPPLYTEPVFIEGRRSLDGVIGMPYPARELVEGWRLDALIVFTNYPRNYVRPQKREAIFARLMPRQLRRPFMTRDERFKEGETWLRHSGIPHLCFYTDNTVGSFTQTPRLIRAAAERAHDYVYKTFKDAGA